MEKQAGEEEWGFSILQATELHSQGIRGELVLKLLFTAQPLPWRSASCVLSRDLREPCRVCFGGVFSVTGVSLGSKTKSHLFPPHPPELLHQKGAQRGPACYHLHQPSPSMKTLGLLIHLEG